jgi:hypothetical protein
VRREPTVRERRQVADAISRLLERVAVGELIAPPALVRRLRAIVQALKDTTPAR